jgi:hypothetical protein
MEKNMTEEVASYKCNWCGKLHKYESDANRCAFDHAKKNYANSLLREGHSLSRINYVCGFGWKLTKEQEDITQDNCFIVSHWQCCEKPAYKIVDISSNGILELRGKGSWSGYYGNSVSIDRLPKPYPKEDLFVDQR